jgi:hypothetical protein
VKRKRKQSRVELIGGPLDGETMRAPSRVRYIWASAGERWALYRAADVTERRLTFVRIVAKLGDGIADDESGNV